MTKQIKESVKEFLESKKISIHSVEATRLPHKFKNIEYELIPLMEEYAIQKQIDLLEKLNTKISKQLSTDDKRYFNEFDIQTYYTIDCNNKEINQQKKILDYLKDL